MGSFINAVEFKRIRNKHGQAVAEAAYRGERPDLLERMRGALRVSDPDSEEIERPARPFVERRTRPVTERHSISPIETPPEVSTKEAPTETTNQRQPILNPIQAQFVRIAWAVQARRKRPVTQAELEVIRDNIYFGGNFFASMGMLERVDAIVRDDDGTTIRYRINKPRFPQLQDADDEIIRLAVRNTPAESP